MMRYARLEESKVREILETDGDIKKMFHPELIWVPCSSEVREGWVWNGATFTAPTLPSPTQADYVNTIQGHLDDVARTRNYDGIMSLCTYATSKHPKFSVEGQAGVDWRDACWAHGYAVMADVYAGRRPAPTIEELIDELPAMIWPN
jgi:hypothetical protein